MDLAPCCPAADIDGDLSHEATEAPMTATLAHVQQRYTLLAICNDCAHTVELDVDGLIDTLGPDHPVSAPAAPTCLKSIPLPKPRW